MGNRELECVFCKTDFPLEYQLISDAPEYWFFVSNRSPQTDYHCLIVLKSKVIDKYGHISDLSDERLPDEAMEEFGILLKRACVAIKASDPLQIEKVLIASLNTGEHSKHLHFHLIPKRYEEPIKTVNDPCKDGGGMFFLARKEVVHDTFSDFLRSTTGDRAEELICKIKEEATKDRVKENTLRLKKNFKWERK